MVFGKPFPSLQKLLAFFSPAKDNNNMQPYQLFFLLLGLGVIQLLEFFLLEWEGYSCAPALDIKRSSSSRNGTWFL
jgi:hypothetical protein